MLLLCTTTEFRSRNVTASALHNTLADSGNQHLQQTVLRCLKPCAAGPCRSCQMPEPHHKQYAFLKPIPKSWQQHKAPRLSYLCFESSTKTTTKMKALCIRTAHSQRLERATSRDIIHPSSKEQLRAPGALATDKMLLAAHLMTGYSLSL